MDHIQQRRIPPISEELLIGFHSRTRCDLGPIDIHRSAFGLVDLQTSPSYRTTLSVAPVPGVL
jgi:hypothetical protein